MIMGVIVRKGSHIISAERFQDSLVAAQVTTSAPHVCAWKEGAFGYCSPYVMDKYEEMHPIVNTDHSLAIVVSGRIYNERDLWRTLGEEEAVQETKTQTELFLQLYLKFDLDFVTRLNGKFAFAIWDRKQHRLVLGRDRFGIEPLYYSLNEKLVVFGSYAHSIIHYTGEPKILNNQALARFLLFKL